MPPVPDFQGVLLDKAAQDARAAEVMRDDVRFSDEIVGFHCQQAVEKAIKAVLETLRIEYPLNHDLVVLLNLLGEHAFACPVSLDEAKQLKPFAVRFRYDELVQVDAPSPAFDRAQAVRTATLTVAWAKGLVQP